MPPYEATVGRASFGCMTSLVIFSRMATAMVRTRRSEEVINSLTSAASLTTDERMKSVPLCPFGTEFELTEAHEECGCNIHYEQ
ncbi:hypothetical protein BHE74_00011661 [Ensete ventricosum]|nr:hypothetical protein BHE74_00011661 [Ensete ventricosum]